MAFKFEQSSQCLGKHQFTSKSVADSTFKRKKFDMSSYKCPHCGYWHVAHTSGGRKNTMKRPPMDDFLE